MKHSKTTNQHSIDEMQHRDVIKIKPNDNWRWYFSDEYQRMMLDLSDDYLFRSRFSARSLTDDAFQSRIFNVDDASQYYIFSEKCQSLDLTIAQQAELVLNALVALRFLKPQMPKSWYFAIQQSGWQPGNADIALVCLHDHSLPVYLLVVEPGEHASLCVLAQPELVLPGRNMCLGEAIKIMNDRLLPVSHWQQRSLCLAV